MSIVERDLYSPSRAAFRQERAAFLALMASGIIWGLIWWPLKYFAQQGLSGHAIGLTAYAFVAVATLPAIWRQRSVWRAEAGWLLLIGLCFGCANMAFTAALTAGPVVRAMLLFYLLPCWGALGGALFLHERIGPRRLTAVVLSLAGVFVIMGGTDVLRRPPSLADVMALAAGLGYTAAGIANRKAKAIPVTSRALSAFVGCAVVAVAALPFSAPALPSLPPSVWALLVLFAFVWLLGGTLVTTYGVMHVQASRAAVLQVVELLVAVVSAVLIGGEAMTAKDWTGGAMIVAATLIEATNTGTEEGP